jgi:ribonuclease-3
MEATASAAEEGPSVDHEMAAITSFPAPGEDNPERLAAALGITMRNPELLRLALTHRSVVHEWAAAVPGSPIPQSNERLEFLGDAILGAVVADLLYRTFPDASEGELTARRAALVRAEQLVRWAKEINLGEYLYLAQGERVSGSARDRMLAGAFEALVGAMFLDRGWSGAKRFLRPFLKRDLNRVIAAQEHANPKGRLQEIAQERFRQAPHYHVVRIEGPAHARKFTVEVSLAGQVLAVGTGRSKRDAEQEAARLALQRLSMSDAAEGSEGISAHTGVRE